MFSVFIAYSADSFSAFRSLALLTEQQKFDLCVPGHQFAQPSSNARYPVATSQAVRFGQTFNYTAPTSDRPLNTKYIVTGILFVCNLI